MNWNVGNDDAIPDYAAWIGLNEDQVSQR